MQRSLAILGLLASACLANAQTSTAPTGWARVEAQAVGTKVQVKATKDSATCAVRSVTEAALICVKDGKELTFQHADVMRIRVAHRGRSTLAGFGIGAGAGAIAGVGVSSGSNGFFTKGQAAGVLGGVFGVIGAGIGAATDFTHSTIYSMK